MIVVGVVVGEGREGDVSQEILVMFWSNSQYRHVSTQLCNRHPEKGIE